MKKKPGTDEKAYVVCAKPNGVFFGYALPGETTGDQVTLRRARMLVKWSEATHSVVGAASIGPQKGSRVSPAVPEITLRDIECVMLCSDAAKEAFEAEPWG